MSEKPNDNNSEPQSSVWLFWLRRPGLAIPALYGLSSVIGMLFYWAYFREFGIDIFAYVDTSDLLLASFRRPIVWLVLILSVLAVHSDNLSSIRFARKPRSRWTAWYGSPGYRRLNLFIGVGLVVGFIVLLAVTSADQVREGKADRVRLIFAEDGSEFEAQLIGTSTRFIYLHDGASERVWALPFEALRSIETVAPPPLPEPDSANPQAETAPTEEVPAVEAPGEAQD